MLENRISCDKIIIACFLCISWKIFKLNFKKNFWFFKIVENMSKCQYFKIYQYFKIIENMLKTDSKVQTWPSCTNIPDFNSLFLLSIRGTGN